MMDEFMNLPPKKGKLNVIGKTSSILNESGMISFVHEQ